MRGIDLVMEKLAFLGAARPPQITGRKSVGIGPINTGAAAARAPRSSGTNKPFAYDPRVMRRPANVGGPAPRNPFAGGAKPPSMSGRKSVGIGPINTGAAAARAPRSSGISYTARGPARAPAVVKTKFDPSKLRNPYG